MTRFAAAMMRALAALKKMAALKKTDSKIRNFQLRIGKLAFYFTVPKSGRDEKHNKNGRRRASTSIDRRPGRKLQSGQRCSMRSHICLLNKTYLVEVA